MKIRKWRLEHHPTVDPIPIEIVLSFGSTDADDYVPLLKNKIFYNRAKNLVDEHNALVDELERLKAERS